MDPRKFTTVAHGWRRFLGPVLPEKADRILAALQLTPEDHVLDIGSGKGEFLIRAAEQFGCHGTGVDMNDDFLGDAKSEAKMRGVDQLVEFKKFDAKKFLKSERDFTVAICTGATHALGGFRATLDAFHKLLPVGGRALIADGFWKQKPSQAYLDFLGGVEEELFDHLGNRNQLTGAGFQPTYVTESSLDDWDDYEGQYIGAAVDYCLKNPDDKDSPGILNRIRAWNDVYHQMGRDTLGLGWYVGINLGSNESR